MKVLKPSSPYLEVTPVARKGRNGPVADGSGKVAAGMEVAFTVRFTPPSPEDFGADLVLATEREKFIVPVRAIGTRACLDFPDVVAFEPTPAKEASTRSFLVRNVGTRAGAFELRASPPFSASPTVASLGAEESLQVVLGFAPESLGSFQGELEARKDPPRPPPHVPPCCSVFGGGSPLLSPHVAHIYLVPLGASAIPQPPPQVCYEGGRSAFVELRGDGVEVDVGLSTSRLELLATFIHTQSQRTFHITNRSGSAISFEFKKNPTPAADDDERNAVLRTLQGAMAAGQGAPAADLWRKAPRRGSRASRGRFGGGIDGDGGDGEVMLSFGDGDGDGDEAAGSGSGSGTDADEAALADRGAELTREFRARAAAVQADHLPFESHIFFISPCSGQARRPPARRGASAPSLASGACLRCSGSPP